MFSGHRDLAISGAPLTSAVGHASFARFLCPDHVITLSLFLGANIQYPYSLIYELQNMLLSYFQDGS